MDPTGKNHNWLLGTCVNKENLVKWIVDLGNKISTWTKKMLNKTAPLNIELLKTPSLPC